MCNLDRVCGFLIGAKLAYLAMIGFLIAAGISAVGNIFTATASIGLMVGASVSIGVATALFAIALFDVSQCRGPCDSALTPVKNWLIALIASCGIILVLIIVATAITPVPVAGVVAVSKVLIYVEMSGGVMIIVESLLTVGFATALNQFNACQAANNRPSSSTLLTIFNVILFFSFIGSAVVGLSIGLIWSVIALGVGTGVVGLTLAFQKG